MFKRFSFPLTLLILLIILILSPDFKEIAGGVAIFLFGMRFLQTGFKNFTGGAFEKLLQTSTDKSWKGMLFGFIASSLMQSSSLVGIITISFLGAELISLIQGIWILLGANIGTTTGIWLIAGFGLKLNIAALGMPMIVLGIICVFQKDKIISGIGNVLAGLGFVFLGIHYMKVGFESFSTAIDLTRFAIEGYLGVIIFTLIGLLMTIVMQSSHATIMLVLTALFMGQVSYENALAMVIGANIGTNVTSFFVSLTGNKDSKRLGLNDLILKVVASLVFIVFFYQILYVIDIGSIILGIRADNYPLKLALFHTLFNIVGVSIMLIFINNFVIVLKKVFPDEKMNVYGSIYLNKNDLTLPDTAIISLIKETRHLYYNTIEILLESIGLRKTDLSNNMIFEELKKKIKVLDSEDIDNLYNKKIKVLYGEILDYASNAQANNEDIYFEDFRKIKLASRNLAEMVKGMKHIQKNLKKYLRSTNSEIKKQYEEIVFDLLKSINQGNQLQYLESGDDKLMIISNIKRKIRDQDVIGNGTVDKLIREQKISNEMATSLINDSNYKTEILNNLLYACEVIFNNSISDNITALNDKRGKHWLSDNFGLSEKKIKKMVEKYKKKEIKLKEDLDKERDEEKKENISSQIRQIRYFINTYKKKK